MLRRSAGSIKWLEAEPFDNADLAALATATSQVPGADERTPLFWSGGSRA
ncbi:MAG: hypothetical protein ACYDBS_09875 [Acidimicrobiales bacterium]